MDNNLGLIRIVLVHVLFWLVFAILPPLFADISMKVYSSFWLTGMSMMVIFYSNYFKIVESTLFLGRRISFFLINFALILFFTLFCDWWYSKFEGSNMFNHIGTMFRDFSVGVLVVSLATALLFARKLMKVDNERKKMERMIVEDELNHLRTQLHPHFLFNTLNVIYALIGLDEAKAQEAVKCLSVLLRYVLYEDRSKGPQRIVEVQQEEEFLRTFVRLMEFRMRPNVKITYKAEISEHPDAPCLVLLFISLIENAFTYGISPVDESPVDIYLAAPQRDTIIFKIKNRDFSEIQSKKHKIKELTKETHGIGIENTRRRLSLVYGEDATFEAKSDGTYFTTELVLHFTERNYYYAETPSNGNTSV
ncbi:MAG: histidine kinase [Paludibacteraceae bacterium]|nr:histidine kinase [Paludibacteraceae bacterium]